MHRALTTRLLTRAFKVGEVVSSPGVPLYLCPAIVGLSNQSPGTTAICRPGISRCRTNHTEAAHSKKEVPTSEPIELTESTEPTESAESPKTPVRRLPLTCTGCGAFSQSDDPNQLGYFDVERKRVKAWLYPRQHDPSRAQDKGDQVVNEVLSAMDPSQLKELGLDPATLLQGDETEAMSMSSFMRNRSPICDRCHNLTHHSIKSSTAKVAMYHPTVESLRETIEESPHKYNHIYHIIDAADFPMSLIPRLNVLLGDIPLRTRSRRSRTGKFQKDRQTEISFIITRSDLLGPKKEMVDAMMPYLRDVLRDALGRIGQRIRLGNVSCVSARRSWWTTRLKEDIWRRGGAGWMVGKVNVGKSQLFEAVYPKGRVGEKRSGHDVTTYPREAVTAESISGEAALEDEQAFEDMDFGELLPPPQPVQNFPRMPLVSSLPGTTASPIRIPFGNSKGELIDLPGLARSDLELFVKEEHQQSLIMRTRIVPEQVTVKPGKSLLLGGGLIRLTPRTPNTIFLMYNFTPIHEHLTMTEKAIAFQNQSHQSIGVQNITLPGVGDKMKHAGTFMLRHDVTKKRAGPLTRKNAIGLNVDQLPFRVLALDILIEGVGYVEIVAQVRRPEFERLSAAQKARDTYEEESKGKGDSEISDDPFDKMFSLRRDNIHEAATAPKPRTPEPLEPEWPAVDVYTPEGRFVGSRMPINGWLNNKPLVRPEHKKARPRMSMKGAKKKAKQQRSEQGHA